MAVQSLKSFFPTAQDVLDADLPRRGGVLLTHLKSYEGAGTVYQYNGGINREYFFAIMERRNVGLGPLPNNEPEYGADQPKVSMAFREAWNWLEKESYLIHTPGQPVLDWFSITPSGEEFLKRAACFERWEKLTLDRVRSDLENNEGRRTRGVGSGPEELDWAWEWVRMKENKPSLKRCRKVHEGLETRQVDHKNHHHSRLSIAPQGRD